jgi:IMP dehydrogenase
MNKTYSYDDVLLLPQYSDIRSRSEIDISTDLGKGVVLQLPVFASPMDTISEGAMGSAMSEVGGSTIVHRYNTIQEQSNEIDKVKSPRIIGAAIGISGDYLERASALVDSGADFLCVDVAHGPATSQRLRASTILLIGEPTA